MHFGSRFVEDMTKETKLEASVRRGISGVVLCGLSVMGLHAGLVPIDITREANTTWSTFPNILNGNLMPTGAQTYGGVQFNVGNLWSADVQANGLTGLQQVVIPINLPAVSTVYTLLNTEWGEPLANGLFLSYTFNFSDGSSYTVNLYGNQAIRDYNNYTWTNTISSSWSAPQGMTDSTVQVFSDGVGQRLDEQIINIPSSYLGLNMTSLMISDGGNHAPPEDAFLAVPSSDPTHPQRSFLAGLSVNESTIVPEPGTIVLLLSGLGAIVLMRRRRVN